MAFSHQKNSNFQYLSFVFGKAHTADECYRLLKSELDERTESLAISDAAALRREAKRMRAQEILDCDRNDTATKLEAQADIAEMDAAEPTGRKCYEACKREILFIRELLGILEPYRKCAELPDHEAFEACQREEWAEEFKFRAENFFLSQRNIPADQLDAMRKHVDWHSTIEPYLSRVAHSLKESGFLPPEAYKKTEWKMLLEQKIQGQLPAAQVLVRLPSGSDSKSDSDANGTNGGAVVEVAPVRDGEKN